MNHPNIPFSKLPTYLQNDKYNRLKRDYDNLQQKYNRIKNDVDIVYVTDKETNDDLLELYEYLRDNDNELNKALKNKPLLLDFIKDQLQSCLQENKVCI